MSSAAIRDPSGCAFCRRDSELNITDLGDAYARYDGYPVVPGHLLVIPKTHVRSIFHLDGRTEADVWALVREMRDHLARKVGAADYTIGINDGRLAGQTEPHAHIHVIPRFANDLHGRDPRGGVRNLFRPVDAWWDRFQERRPSDPEAAYREWFGPGPAA